MLVFFPLLFNFFYILNIVRVIKKMSVTEIRDFIFKYIMKELHFLRKAIIIQWNA